MNAETVSTALCEHEAGTASCIAVVVEGSLSFCGVFSYRNTFERLTPPFNIETHLNTWAGCVSMSACIWKTNFRSVLSQIKSHFLQEIKVPIL